MKARVNSGFTTQINAAIPEGVALCAAMPFSGDAGEVPEWVHLLPAGREVRTVDGRGPYIADIEKLATLLPEGDRLVLDENHATDLAAPLGLPAPAAGWIVALQARKDGLWGQVEWTEAGRALVAGKAYRAISPALDVEKGTGRVRAVLRASLVNQANIKNLVSLNSETTMNPLLAKLLAALGLPTDTSEETLVTAVTALNQAQAAATTQLNAIAKAAGLDDKATGETILGAVANLAKRPATAGGDATVVALQAELATVTTELNTVRTTLAKDKAVAFVDSAIKAGRVGVKVLRDHYVSMHMVDPTRVEKEIGAMPILNGQTIVPQPNTTGGEVSLNAEESAVTLQLGLDPKAFVKARDGVVA